LQLPRLLFGTDSSLGSGAINLPQHLSTKTLSELRDWLWNEYGLAEEIVNRIVLSKIKEAAERIPRAVQFTSVTKIH